MKKVTRKILSILLATSLVMACFTTTVFALESEESAVGVSYSAHVQDIGWMAWTQDGDIAGTTGQSKRLEAVKINLTNAPEGASISYQVHVRDIGWMAWTQDGDIAGTTGQSRRAEAIAITLSGMPGYSVQYRVHVQDIGWMAWTQDGDIAGTTGRSLRMEAVEIRIVPPTTYAVTVATVVGGRAIVRVDKATAAADETVTVTIPTIAPTKQFASIAVTGTSSGSVETTEVTAGSNYTFTMPAEAVTVTVTVTIKQYTLTYTAGTNGTLTGISPQTVNHLASGTTVTAVPNAGYHFVSWSDGILTAARTDTGVTANITATATFAVGVYVTDEPTLLAALADTNATTIIFANSITLANKATFDYLTIDRPVTIDGQDYALNKGMLIGASNVIVENLAIKPSEFYSGWFYGIMIADVQGVQIVDCIISSPGFTDAVGISDETGSTNTVFTVSGTAISNGWTGILIDSPNTHATLTGNSISYEKHAIYVRLGLSQQVITGNTISNPRTLSDGLTAGDGIEVPTGTTVPVRTALKSANTFVGVVPGNEVVALP